MGGKWPGRLAVMCLEITGVFEDQEEELYRKWKELDEQQMVRLLCLNEDRLVYIIMINI